MFPLRPSNVSELSSRLNVSFIHDSTSIAIQYYDLLRFLLTYLTLDHGKKLNHTRLETVYLQRQYTSHVSHYCGSSIIAILGVFKESLHATVDGVYFLYSLGIPMLPCTLEISICQTVW